MGRLGEKLRGKVLDFTAPGWRQRPLMADILAHQERIRSDPQIQAVRRQVHRDSMRFVRALSAGFLLLPVIVWSAYALASGKSWSLALNSTAGALYASWALGVVVLYAVLARE